MSQLLSNIKEMLATLSNEKKGVFLLNGEVELIASGLSQVSVGKQILVYDYATTLPRYPYEPWLGMVIDRLQELSLPQRQKLYREANIYYVLQQLLESSLTTGVASREESLIEEEYLYEKREILDGVWKLFIKLVALEASIVVVLKNIHKASPSSLFFLDFVLDGECSSLQVVGIYDFAAGSVSQELESLIKKAEEKRIVFDLWSGEGEERTEQEKPAEEDYHQLDEEEKLLLQERSLAFLAACDGYQLGRKRLDKDDFFSLREDLQIRWYWNTAKAALLLKEWNEAAVYLNSAFVLMQRSHVSVAEHMLIYRDMAYIFLMKDNIVDALDLIEKAFHLSGSESYKKAYFEVFFLYFEIEDKNRKQQPRPWRAIYDRIIALATDLNYENHLAKIYINPYGIYSEYASDADKYNTLIFNEKGIALAKKLHNIYRLSHGYQIRGLIYAVIGQYDQVIQWYRRSLVLKKRMGLPLEIAYGYNGVGFYYYMTGKYPQAYEYYTQALDYLYNLKDFHEIAMTYFNMGMDCLLGLDYQHAAIFFEEVLELIEILQLNGLAYHSLFGIYAVLGTSYALLSRWSQAYDCVNRIRRKKLLPYLEKNEEYFYIAMLLALLASHEGKKQEMLQRLREANYYLHRTNDNIGYMIPWYCLVTAQLYEASGEDKLFVQAWREGKQQSEILDYPFYRSIFQKRKEDTYAPAFEIALLPQFHHIRELARAEERRTRIYRQMQDVHVLNVLQQDFIEKSSALEVITSVLEKLVQSFLIDFACFLERRNGEWHEVYHAGKIPECSGVDDMIALFEGKTQEVLLRRDSGTALWKKELESISSIVYIPLSMENHKAILFCGTLHGSVLLTKDDLQVLKLIGQQMEASFQRLSYLAEIENQKKQLEEANKRLREMALHDVLTGVMNRLALTQRLEEEIERVHRYSKKVDTTFSLLFLDMDNFKQINDTYGHTMGDKVLAKSAQHLVSLLRKVDLVFRYGGDEFVVLLPETSASESIALVQRIQQQVPLKVRDDLHLDILPTFSIGVVDYGGGNEVSLEELLQRVDKALYQAKLQGKNCFVLLDEE